MNDFISLLRGINVGSKTIKMEILKGLYESLGFYDVKTYIQSGNVLFNAKSKKIGEIKSRIEKIIKTDLKLDVIVIIRNQGSFRRIIENNPFITSERTESEKLYVTFLDKKPEDALLQSIASNVDTKDEWRIIGSELFLFCPGGYGRTVFSNSFFKKN